MSMHKFHTRCDHDQCTNCSDEYTAYPSCRECMLHTCPEHTEPDTETDPDVNQPSTCICKNCWREFHEEGDERVDEQYERAVARARDNDFEDTDGKDWT